MSSDVVPAGRAGIPSLSILFSDAWRLVVRPEPVAKAAAGDGMPHGLAVTVPTQGHHGHARLLRASHLVSVPPAC